MRGTTNATAPVIHLRIDRLWAAAQKRGCSDAGDIARLIGTSGANLSRLTTDDPDKRQLPGEQFIAAVWAAFRDEYPNAPEYFFELVIPRAMERSSTPGQVAA